MAAASPPFRYHDMKTRPQATMRYYLNKLWKFFGFCRNCRNRLNFTRTGAGVCPYCGRRY